MKQESKDLIIWIKKQINLAKENCIDPCHKDGYPEYEADYEKAMKFLDSLPEIEKMDKESFYLVTIPPMPLNETCEIDSYLNNNKIRHIIIYNDIEIKKVPVKEKCELLEYIKKQIGIEG